jgi:hypothetical protein
LLGYVITGKAHEAMIGAREAARIIKKSPGQGGPGGLLGPFDNIVAESKTVP